MPGSAHMLVGAAGVSFTTIGIFGAFVVSASLAVVKVWGWWTTKETARRQAAIDEAKRIAVAEALAVDPQALAREVTLLKVAVQGRDADEYGNGGVTGLTDRMTGVERSIDGMSGTLGTLVSKVDQVLANGNGH